MHPNHPFSDRLPATTPLLFDGELFFVFSSIAQRRRYKPGDVITDHWEYIILVNENANYYKLLVEAELRTSN